MSSKMMYAVGENGIVPPSATLIARHIETGELWIFSHKGDERAYREGNERNHRSFEWFSDEPVKLKYQHTFGDTILVKENAREPDANDHFAVCLGNGNYLTDNGYFLHETEILKMDTIFKPNLYTLT